jgi:2-polyprenyl-6-methoxyphenol hydroxylase-like FAD-dependent oxidoreductase
LAAIDTDVLIVGAGPTGLMLACQLARRGVHPLLIDRHAGPARETRALGVQARTMEIYAQLGVVERALELGKKGTGANVWANGRRAARLPLGEIGRAATPYSYLFILGQDDNERILGERLRELGGAVQWNTELTGLEQHADHVLATLKQPDGMLKTIKAAWVPGCDGARSAVRALNGIDFPGAPYEHVFYVADVEATGTMVPDEVNVYLGKEGFLLFFPMRGTDHWRIVGILPDALAGPEGERRGVAFEDVLPAVRGAAGPALQFRKNSWFSTYRIHHRAAASFRRGRCFLLGDAAHIHSPVGAQGMNTGLQDAYNLAWKLALVLQGKAEARLLDSYEAERIPIARRLLETTDRGFRLAVSQGPLARLVRTHVAARVAAFALGLQRVQRFAFRLISQTGIHYRASALSESAPGLPEGSVRAGDRFPWLQLKFQAGGAVEDSFRRLDDLRFHLLLFGQEAPAPVHELVQVHRIPSDPANDAELARAGIPTPSFYLIRPDGHVGLCGLRLESGVVIAAYLRRLLQPPAR